MSTKTRVDILQQPTRWTCFHSCLVMLDRYRSSRNGVFHQPSDLERRLYPDSKKQRINPRANAYVLGKGQCGSALHEYLVRRYRGKPPSGLLSPNDARGLAKMMGFAYSTIKPELTSFERILNVYGPFIWVGSLIHTVLVVSRTQRGTQYYVSSNDPNGARRREEEEFYGFLTDLMPSMKVLNKDSYEVFHIKR